MKEIAEKVIDDLFSNVTEHFLYYSIVVFYIVLYCSDNKEYITNTIITTFFGSFDMLIYINNALSFIVMGLWFVTFLLLSLAAFKRVNINNKKYIDAKVRWYSKYCKMCIFTLRITALKLITYLLVSYKLSFTEVITGILPSFVGITVIFLFLKSAYYFKKDQA